MLQEERLLYILDYLKSHRAMSVPDICRHLGVSRDTARRDIVRLTEDGSAVRTHGGIALPRLNKPFASYRERSTEQSEAKRRIGRVAAGMIRDDETVILDVATTVKAVAERIEAKGVTVITHSIDNVGVLMDKPHVQIYMLGGYLHKEHHLLYGPSVLEKLSELRADKAIIGVSAIVSDGLMYPYEEDARVKREMARRADQVIAVADSSKLAAMSGFRLGLEWVDVLVTDKIVPGEMQEALDRHEVEVVICGDISEEEGEA
ncbi:DeoR/GlpR family DNA-binding transcription regulator [Paenibacillus hodogayensis]|uniref:DeoR/GlpR family DNA-binding transcription regulator n=1 Tax=Paenibacillus hodogayensis TaxID=279208 RepID=A0ABV5VZP5_9BACL